MTDQDSPQFIARLIAASELYGSKLSESSQVLYFEALRDLELQTVCAALAKAIQTCKFMPRPSEIRDIALGAFSDRVEIAWQAWRLAARRIGGGASLVLEDAPLAETITAVFGGWPQACSVELSDEMWAAKRKEFDRVYRVFVLRQVDGTRYLTGSHEINNSVREDWQQFTPIGFISSAGQVKQISRDTALALRGFPKELDA